MCQIWFASDPDRLGSMGQKWAGWFLYTGLLPDWIHSAKTWHNQLELNLIQAGFAQYDLGCLWMIATESESGQLVASRLYPTRNRAQWFLHTGLLPYQMNFAKPWQGHPDQIQISFVQYDQCFIWKKRNWVGCRKSYPAHRIWANSGRNGHNWL